MARTAKSTNTEPVVDAATVDDSTVAAVNSVEENMNDKLQLSLQSVLLGARIRDSLPMLRTLFLILI